jgi:hypothetical protein
MGQQEPNVKKCPFHTTSIHSGAFMCAGFLWPTNMDPNKPKGYDLREGPYQPIQQFSSLHKW